MLRLRNLHGALALALVATSLTAQTPDTSRAGRPQPIDIQFTRAYDARGRNTFEVPKSESLPYRGFRMQLHAAFAQQYQALTHANDADSVFVPAVAPVPGNAGTAATSDRNRLIELGSGFNNATANLVLNTQLARGIRVQMTSYLSARRHNETWVKDGFIQIDASPFDVPMFDRLMRDLTVKVGHFEVNYGDQHFRRTDNGQAIYNRLVGNPILDAFTTEVGAEAIYQRHGWLVVAAVTNGEIRGNLARPDDRDPAKMLKVGFDRQLSDDLRVRLTGSWRDQRSAISNTLYNGDRAGSRYYFVMENFRATESANPTSGAINPGFSDAARSIMINPFVEFRGLEFFGLYEIAEGRSAAETETREITHTLWELTYQLPRVNGLYLSGRYNSLTGDLGTTGTGPTLQDNSDVRVNRIQLGGGWQLSPNLLLKAEYVDQTYGGFSRRDIRSGGRFSGVILEAVTAW
jgi:hypothetical protein